MLKLWLSLWTPLATIVNLILCYMDLIRILTLLYCYQYNMFKRKKVSHRLNTIPFVSKTKRQLGDVVCGFGLFLTVILDVGRLGETAWTVINLQQQKKTRHQRHIRMCLTEFTWCHCMHLLRHCRVSCVLAYGRRDRKTDVTQTIVDCFVVYWDIVLRHCVSGCFRKRFACMQVL